MRSKGAASKDERLARAQVRQLVRVARPKLEQCYAEALARAPVLVSKVELGVTVGTDGAIADATFASGKVVDAVGNACVLWAVMEAKPPLPDERLATNVTLDLPVTFFIQNADGPRPDFAPPSGGFLDGGSANPGEALRQYGAGRATQSDAGANVGERQR